VPNRQDNPGPEPLGPPRPVAGNLYFYFLIEKNINQITFYFVEEGPGRASGNIKKERNCFNFFFFSVFLMDIMRGKITINLKELHLNRKIRNICTPKKS
jgi:hypothetical protein